MSQIVTQQIHENAAHSPIRFRISMPSVFDFHDYRDYLRDVIRTRKRNDSKYTIQKFAKKLGFSSHSGLIMILNGKRELQDPYLDRCTKELALNAKQRLYFDSLVRAGKQSPSRRKALLREMEFHSSEWDPPSTSESFRLVDFFLVQQILSLYREYLPLTKILAHFRYAVNRQDVLDALDWMIAQGYVDKYGDAYKITNSVLMIQDESPSASGRQLHRDCLKLAASSLDEDAIDAREFQTYLMTVNSKRIGEMKQKIKKLVLETIHEFETELDGDTVVQMHFNLFEMSHRLNAKETSNA